MYSSIDNIDGTVRCVYSGYSVEHTVGDQSTPAEFSCEHSYCQSWIDSEIVGIENDRAKADLHHLFPVKFSVNSARSNHPFDNRESCTNTYSEDGGNTISCLGINQEDNVVFEPDEQHKGDLARALLYFIVRYETGLTFGNVEMLETILEWHYEDSVSSTELDRNDAIYDFQTNRNPFVDHPEFVEEIWVGEPSIYVTFPNQTIVLGTSLDYTITWLSQYVYQNVKIELLNQNSGETTELISSTEDDGEWEWTNLENIEPNNDYQIRISDISNSNIFAECDNDFSIILTDPQSDLFISEYGEGSSYNKYIEIYNGIGACVDFSGYALKIYSNGNTDSSYSIALSGLIYKDGLFVVAYPSACDEILIHTDLTYGGINFNGNDAVALYHNDLLIDLIGNIGEDPGDGWNVSEISNATRDHTLVRKELISSGNHDWEKSAGTNSTDSEWLVYNYDTFDYLGSHIMNIPLGVPENVTLTSDGANITITWDAVDRATSYRIESCDTPYGTFVEDTGGSFVAASWSKVENSEKKFYRLIAEN